MWRSGTARPVERQITARERENGRRNPRRRTDKEWQCLYYELSYEPTPTREVESEAMAVSVSPPACGELPAASGDMAGRRVELCAPRRYPERLDFLYDAEVDREIEREQHHLHP
ncbi:hypothetical protein KV113_17615 [Mycolicibacter sp. MYC340]|uniref:Uncharacterized protein n=1 Tax=[Mycobacterium] nativiensis TaxID=2855503 RepID=A0ABU5XZS0_9MYCO|nr:hypothetical protein [Mycolicibacter sp. MYC340]